MAPGILAWLFGSLAPTPTEIHVHTTTDQPLPPNVLIGNTLTATGNGALVRVGGVTIKVGDLILVKDEADARKNGVYVVVSVGSSTTPWVLVRVSYLDESSEFVAGLIVVVDGGYYAGSRWSLLTPNPVMGVSDILFQVVGVLVRRDVVGVVVAPYEGDMTVIPTRHDGTWWYDLPVDIGGVRLVLEFAYLEAIGWTVSAKSESGERLVSGQRVIVGCPLFAGRRLGYSGALVCVALDGDSDVQPGLSDMGDGCRCELIHFGV